ncbi:hypothetical protein [Phytoactinopolyspora halotolerans]|uniref:hypothetical protein n=1 Tax=Phytoactinopolyspora halotolerans TaxID=1981512 RepID=UPI001C208B61|nr:hypothetical protein [Phytoactinopolyspora halotolerans]
MDLVSGSARARVQLYWLPLGAGGRSVRVNGKVFEALAAWREHRPARDLYHAALEVRVHDERYVIEVAPAWGNGTGERGVALTGPVGCAWLGQSVLFRYEVRCWRDGAIPDVAYAVGGAHVLSEDVRRASELLSLVPRAPRLTWGRDELGTGDMWNSNSVVSWLLVSSGHMVDTLRPPRNGRAPGWSSGLIHAARWPATGTITPRA